MYLLIIKNPDYTMYSRYGSLRWMLLWAYTTQAFTHLLSEYISSTLHPPPPPNPIINMLVSQKSLTLSIRNLDNNNNEQKKTKTLSNM